MKVVWILVLAMANVFAIDFDTFDYEVKEVKEEVVSTTSTVTTTLSTTTTNDSTTTTVTPTATLATTNVTLPTTTNLTTTTAATTTTLATTTPNDEYTGFLLDKISDIIERKFNEWKLRHQQTTTETTTTTTEQPTTEQPKELDGFSIADNEFDNFPSLPDFPKMDTTKADNKFLGFNLSVTDRIYLACGIPALVVLVIMAITCLACCCRKSENKTTEVLN